MKILITTIACVLAFGVANAQMETGAPTKPESPATAAPEKPDGGASEDRRVEDHIKQLHKELHITAAQEAQWDNVAKTMRENAKDIDRVIDKRDAAIRSATAVEDLDSYADVVQAHAQAVKRLADTFSTLYSEMSDGQKKIADEVFSHRHHESTAARN